MKPRIFLVLAIALAMAGCAARSTPDVEGETIEIICNEVTDSGAVFARARVYTEPADVVTDPDYPWALGGTSDYLTVNVGPCVEGETILATFVE